MLLLLLAGRVVPLVLDVGGQEVRFTQLWGTYRQVQSLGAHAARRLGNWDVVHGSTDGESVASLLSLLPFFLVLIIIAKAPL